uniref:WD_REPEATS_REGION domain-containing protein n=1 Tax=Macrostomum lignano TaxID=282301 RepID=A0A1I8HDR9_9PLAT
LELRPEDSQRPVPDEVDLPDAAQRSRDRRRQPRRPPVHRFATLAKSTPIRPAAQGIGPGFPGMLRHLLVGVTEDNRMHNLDDCCRTSPSGQLIGTVELDASAYPVSALCHPFTTSPTKIVLGSAGAAAHLQIWNVVKARLVHAFQPLEAGVTCLTQAPAEDLLARLILPAHHLRCDVTVVKLRQDFGPVAGLTFRTDGQPIMLSGSRQGQVTVWHLEDRRVCGLLNDAHPSAAIAGLACLHSQPLLVTTGADNCLRIWIFDRPGDHLRACCTSAPDTAGRLAMSDSMPAPASAATGLDSGVRLFSLESESLSRCLGKAKRSGKSLGQILPPVSALACEQPARHGDWCTMVACHSGSRLATTWDLRKGCQGHLRLEPRLMSSNEAAYKTAVATSVDISGCGNFVLIGYSTGHVIRYNVQSGREAKKPYEPTLPAAALCVRCDAHNRMALAVDVNGGLGVYAFKRGHRLASLTVFENPDSGGATAAELHRASGLVAVASAAEIRLYQLAPSVSDPMRAIATGSRGQPVSRLRFSPDGAWLMAAVGSSLYTYSVMLGCLIDRLDCPAPPIVCFDMSPTGDLLVTGHQDRLGLQVWVNSTLFKPLIGGLTVDSASAAAADSDGDSTGGDGLVTLTGLPPGRWQCLVDLDAIRRAQRSPAAAGAEGGSVFPRRNFVFDKVDNCGEVGAGAAGFHGRQSEPILLSEFSRRLLLASDDASSENSRQDRLIACLTHLEGLNPTAIDSEIRDLSDDLFAAFLHAAAACLERGTHFETSQAYLAVFLRHHCVAIATAASTESESCRTALANLRKIQRQVWSRIADSMLETESLLAYTREGLVGHGM